MIKINLILISFLYLNFSSSNCSQLIETSKIKTPLLATTLIDSADPEKLFDDSIDAYLLKIKSLEPQLSLNDQTQTKKRLGILKNFLLEINPSKKNHRQFFDEFLIVVSTNEIIDNIIEKKEKKITASVTAVSELISSLKGFNPESKLKLKFSTDMIMKESIARLIDYSRYAKIINGKSKLRYQRIDRLCEHISSFQSIYEIDKSEIYWASFLIQKYYGWTQGFSPEQKIDKIIGEFQDTIFQIAEAFKDKV